MSAIQSDERIGCPVLHWHEVDVILSSIHCGPEVGAERVLYTNVVDRCWRVPPVDLKRLLEGLATVQTL